MTIEKQTYIYEILIRGAADGSISGAHQVHAERVIDVVTGQVLAEQVLGAQPLSAKDVSSFIGEAFAGSAVALIALQERIKILDAELEQARADLDELQTTSISADSAPMSVVRNMQLRKAINAAGLRDAIEHYLKTAPYDDRDSWEWKEFISIDAPEIIAACDALGVSNDQRAALFEAAAAY